MKKGLTNLFFFLCLAVNGLMAQSTSKPIFDNYIGVGELMQISPRVDYTLPLDGQYLLKKNDSIVKKLYISNFVNGLAAWWQATSTQELGFVNFSYHYVDTLNHDTTLLWQDSIYIHNDGFYCTNGGCWVGYTNSMYNYTRPIKTMEKFQVIMRSVVPTRNTPITIIPQINRVGNYQTQLELRASPKTDPSVSLPAIFLGPILNDSAQSCIILNPDTSKFYTAKWHMWLTCPGDDDENPNGFKSTSKIMGDLTPGMCALAPDGNGFKPMTFLHVVEPLNEPIVTCSSKTYCGGCLVVNWDDPGQDQYYYGEADMLHIYVINMNGDTVASINGMALHHGEVAFWGALGSYYKVVFSQNRKRFCRWVYAECGIGTPTDIKTEESVSEIKLYPNPALNKIQIEGMTTTVSEIEIMTIEGKRLLKALYKAGEEIDISQFQPGIYYLSVTVDKKNINLKFIKE